MSLMTWSNDYSVGVSAMDVQHQKWFGILNQLHDAMMAGKARNLQQNILAEMVSYTRTHFAHEEALLKTRRYPKLAEHQRKHEDFKRQVTDLQAKFESGGSVLSVEVMDFLKQWFSRHILAEDIQYGAWMKVR